MFKSFTIVFFIIFSNTLFAQIGGKNGFEFINIPSNAKIAGVGGMNISIKDYDPNMFFSNPALLNGDMKNHGSMSYYRYYADIWSSSLAYAFDTKKYGLFGAGLQYVEYGKAPSTDESGNVTGSVSANEYAFTVSKSHTIENYTMGVNLKFAHSQIAGLGASAIMADIGGVFKHPRKDFTTGLLIKNVGFAFNNYVAGQQVAVPFDVQAGFTYKLEHMPLRFSMTLHHLHQFDIAYDDPSYAVGYDLNGNPIYQNVSVADKIARHFVIGGEFILAKGFHIRAGYNHLRRSELKMDNYGGLGGFSFGAMLRIKTFELGYTSAFYHAVGTTNLFTLIINFNNFYKSAEIPKAPKEG